MPSRCGGQSLLGKLEDSLSRVNNITTLHDRLATEDELVITVVNKKDFYK